MAIEFECPECETTIRVKDSAAGKTGRCPKCRVLLMVPDPDDWEDEEGEDVEEDSADEPSNEPEAVDEDEAPGPMFPEMVDTPEITEVPVISTEPVPAEPEPVSPEPTPPPVASAPTPPPESIPAPAPEESIPTPSPAPSPPPSLGEAEPAPEGGFPLNTGFPMETGFGGTESVSASVLRGRSSKKRRQPMPTKQKITILSAVGGIALLLGIGFWFYLGTLPDLTGPIAGERLARVSFAEVPIRVPEDIPGETADFVATELRTQPLTMKSEFLEVVIYPGASRQLDAAIASGARSVAVRVPLASHPEIRKAMITVESRIAKQKDAELQRATSDLVKAYAAHVRDKAPMSHLQQLRDQMALNASVSAVGYSLVATVGSTPFRCAYEDAEGYCYFFVPANTRSFRINGRKVFGEGQEPPLPADFEISLTDVATPVSVGTSSASGGAEATPTEKSDEEGKSEASESDKEDAGEKKEPEDAEKKPESEDKPAANATPESDEKPANSSGS